MSTSTPERDRGDYAVPDPRQREWPGISTPPHSAVRARIGRALFLTAVRRLDLRVSMPDGRTVGGGGPDSPVMRIIDAEAFFHRLGVDGKIGFGEAYMAGDWTTRDPIDGLADVLTAFARRLTTLINPKLQGFRRWYDPRHPKNEENTLDGARENIHRHYDLSNDLFALLLDESLTYSSAWFEDGDSLESAQLRKMDGILDLARVRSDTHVLEIGTGWGALAIRAARERGARVTSLTISAEQNALAEERIRAAGVEDRVQVLLRDYREAQGEYDAVVSVEMIEAVGEQYWPEYFAALDRLLRPGGRVGLQSIVMPHDRLIASRHSYTWVHKYIFPGGLIPSIPSIEQQLSAKTTMRIAERRDLGLDYAATLRRWRERFVARRDDVKALGFDETFTRMWTFYLAYCEAGFRVRYLSVAQLGLAREH
ncbi:MAG: class I SAM-dependent methyltransferase [Mycobacteriales bacterium]